MQNINKIHCATAAKDIPEDYVETPKALNADQTAALDAFKVSKKNSALKKIALSRRSVRQYGHVPLLKKELLEILSLSYAYKNTHDVSKVVPSAGALFPINLYCLVNSISNLNSGLYFFDSKHLSLERKEFETKLLNPSELFQSTQTEFSKCSAVIVFTCDFEQMHKKYFERSYRYALLEVGHIAQNMSLSATNLEVPHVFLGGFNDQAITSLLNLKKDMELPLYIAVLGMKNED